MDSTTRVCPIRWAFLLLLMCSFFGGGCATKVQYGKIVDSWVGEKSTQLFRTWNYPNKQITTPAGNTVYIYDRSRTLNFGQPYATSPPYYSVYGGSVNGGLSPNNQIQNLTCTTWFEIDRKTSRIKKVFFKGDLCMAGGLGRDDPPSPPLSSKKN